ncbi:MAG: response regulator [Spirochaetes bacterium]|nr:response regulator [Spirochaetota bacterium]
MGKKIMIVDDTEAIRMSVGFTLQEEGYEVVEAKNGQEALDKLKGTDKIDLILCDVNMPIMDGIEFLRNMKTNESYSSVKFTPIIMLTTEAGEDKKNEGKELGAKAWIVKPFKPEQLIKAVKTLIV